MPATPIQLVTFTHYILLSGACYTKTAGNLHTETTADDVEEEEEDVIIDIDGKDTEKGL